MSSRKNSACYKCGQPATTREHFPPKSFFPAGGNLQLKTVRSCFAHNNSKSGDDQYILTQICINAGKAENLAKQIFMRSVVPQLERSIAFREMLNRDAEWLENGARRYPVDIARFDNFFDSLSCAVFFDRFGCQFDPSTHTLRHIYMSLTSDDPYDQAHKQFISQAMSYFFQHHREQIEHFDAARIDEIVYANDVLAPAGITASVTIGHSFYGVFEVISLMTRKPPQGVAL